jgi:uncharacterized protein HemY
MMLALQVAAVAAAVVALLRWRRRCRRVARVEQRFVEAVLAGDFLVADREVGSWFAAVNPRSRVASLSGSRASGRRTPPPGGAAPDNGLSAA